jgi:uncharacterized membrane protein YdjX (TVP38/TMEM64 family)
MWLRPFSNQGKELMESNGDHETDIQVQADRRFKAIRILVPVPIAILAGLYWGHEGVRGTLDTGVVLLIAADVEGLRIWGEALGVWAPLATLLLMVIQALAAPIPVVLITVLNNLLFGPMVGAVWSILSATVAAVLCFGIARRFGTPLVTRLVPDRVITRTERFMDSHGATTILAARLLPVVPFDPISYVAGLTHMRLWTFVWATALGQIPAGFAYSYLGQEIGDPMRLLLLGVCAFGVLMLIGWSFRKVMRDSDD